MPYRWLPTALAQIADADIEPYEVMQALTRRDITEPVMSDIGPLVAVTGFTATSRRITVVLRCGDGSFDAVIVGAKEDQR
jgi:hypothetical protein